MWLVRGYGMGCCDGVKWVGYKPSTLKAVFIQLPRNEIYLPLYNAFNFRPWNGGTTGSG